MTLRRREFITFFAGAAAWPLAALAQQQRLIGFLGTGSPDPSAYLLRSFRQGLSEIGFVEGRNVTIEYSWANDQLDRLPGLAADLVRRRVSVIIASATPAAAAAKALTTTIPIVFQTGADPVAAGLVASLARPGGNVTGVSSLAGELGPKRLELLHELVPQAAVIPILINPSNQNVPSNLEAAAGRLGIELPVLHASTEAEFDKVFAALPPLRAGALLINGNLFFNTHSEKLAALSIRHAVPSAFQFREFAAAGGLISYGGSLTETYRLLGEYAGRILNGEKPANLPVQQATKVELIVNLRTARALGLTVPLALRARADEVIE
jgi:ABC-type uncharacterized transport system substrate-binding protein